MSAKKQPLKGVTLMFDTLTAQTVGAFFSLTTLLWRNLGAEVLLLAKTEADGDAQVRAMDLGVSRVVAPRAGSGLTWQEWKHKEALQRLAQGSVVWIDVDFANWPANMPTTIDGLTTLNWAQVLKLGTSPGKVAQG